MQIGRWTCTWPLASWVLPFTRGKCYACVSLGRIETTLPAPAAGARSQRGTRPCFLCPLNRHLDLPSQQYLLMLPPQCVLEIPASSRHCHLSSQTQEKLGQARLPAEILQMASGQMRNPIAASSKVQHQAWPALPALSPAFLFLVLPARPCQAPPTAGSLHEPPSLVLPSAFLSLPSSCLSPILFVNPTEPELCCSAPGAQHRAWRRAQVLSLRKTKPSRRWRLQHAGTPSSLLDFVLNVSAR